MAKTGSTAPRTSSTMVRRQLGRQLRQLREACGKTREDVVLTRLMCLGKLKSIEYGRSVVRPGDAYELGRLYGATPEVIEGLRHLAIATAQEGWWEVYGADLVKAFEIYLDLETYATELWAYEPDVIHGLLQTEDYALAVERSSGPNRDETQMQAHAQLRMLRRQWLQERSPQVVVHIVLGEPALRLRVGDDDLHARQHEQLLEIAENGVFDVRVLPADKPHPGLLGGFTVMDFPDPEDPSIVYVDSYVGARYTDRPTHVAQHRDVFEAVYCRTIPVKEFQA
jgi:hypothetical protein